MKSCQDCVLISFLLSSRHSNSSMNVFSLWGWVEDKIKKKRILGISV